jgi:hypothetical protein
MSSEKEISNYLNLDIWEPEHWQIDTLKSPLEIGRAEKVE